MKLLGSTGMGRVIVTVVLAAAIASAAPATSDRARELYQRTDYRSALAMLNSQPDKTAADWDLAGKCYFMLGEFKKSTEAFEQAIRSDSSNSSYYHWLGKAYGRRAETSSPFTAPGLASKARQNFEEAVELDPKNVEAINDLFTYYIEAPGFLGGGLAKAEALANRIKALDPVEYHYVQAQLAERRKDFNTTEQQLRRAAELAPKQVGRVIDLAKFLARQGKVQESEAAFRRAEQIAPNDPQLLFERAATYISGKRNLDTAKQLLKKYLESPLTPNHPSRAEAEKLLRQVGG
jgi:cytochrome c-type biogenesis protein CcmH/NrfG